MLYQQQNIFDDQDKIANENNNLGSGVPVTLSIPSIGVDAPIIMVGLAGDGSVGTPKGPDEVAWFKLGPRPGEKGSSVITGHFGPWQNGAQSVFNNLDKLKQGDKIYVTDDNGAVKTFVVRESALYDPDETAPEVFNKSDGTYLNLITCNGEWLKNEKTYGKRLVVFTDLVS